MFKQWQDTSDVKATLVLVKLEDFFNFNESYVY